MPYEPTPEHIAASEAHIELMERRFREHYAETGLVARVPDGADPSESLEVYTFAFGIMVSILRSSHALVLLGREGMTVESRPIFRSLLDQIIALHSIQARGVHAVHAYGKQLAENYRKLLKASEAGFAWGEANTAYMKFFVGLADGLPSSKESKAAENAIKTYQAAEEAGSPIQGVYQMWLEATPLSKPSMRLADMYINTVVADGEYRVELYFESDPKAVVDPRIIISSVVPLAMLAYAAIVEDPALGAIADELGATSPRG